MQFHCKFRQNFVCCQINSCWSPLNWCCSCSYGKQLFGNFFHLEFHYFCFILFFEYRYVAKFSKRSAYGSMSTAIYTEYSDIKEDSKSWIEVCFVAWNRKCHHLRQWFCRSSNKRAEYSADPNTNQTPKSQLWICSINIKVICVCT